MKNQNSRNNLNSKIEKLKNSPVFALTLGAKELFIVLMWQINIH